MIKPERNDEDGRRTALIELEKLRSQSDVFGGSIGRMMRRASAHFSGKDARGADDAIEIWGKRIGRALGAGAVVLLSIYLVLTYLR